MYNFTNISLTAHYQDHLRDGKIEKCCQHGTGHVIKKQVPDMTEASQITFYEKYCFISRDEMDEIEHVNNRNY